MMVLLRKSLKKGEKKLKKREANVLSGWFLCCVIKKKLVMNMILVAAAVKQLVGKVERQIGEVEAMRDALLVEVAEDDDNDNDNDNNDDNNNDDAKRKTKTMKKTKKKRMIGAALKLIGKADGVYKEAEGVLVECEGLENLLWRLEDAVIGLEHCVEDAGNANDDNDGGVGWGVVLVAGMVGAWWLVWEGFGLLLLA
jgi:hypothetical protein